MPTPQAQELGHTTLYERLDRRFIKIAAGTSIALGALGLAGCAPEAHIDPNANPTQTEQLLTEAQYVDQLTEFKDPAALELPAGSSADAFGKWATETGMKWTLASCSYSKDIIHAFGMLSGDQSLNADIAKSNADALTTAMFGTNWQANKGAADLRAASIDTNTKALTFCLANKKDEIATETYVSTAQTGTDASGNPIYAVTVDVNPGASSEQAGNRVYTYDTAVENGHIIITDFH